MTVLMSPDMANFSGNVHGGAILKLLDQVAYSCASRYSACYVVTLSVDQVMFLQPIHVGELVTFLASVNYTGASSMEVGIKVVAEDIRSQVVRRGGRSFVWSRGEELVTERYPELESLANALPDGTVLDGEILPWKDGAVLPFGDLQKRIGRKTIGKKLLADVPVVLMKADEVWPIHPDDYYWSRYLTAPIDVPDVVLSIVAACERALLDYVKGKFGDLVDRIGGGLKNGRTIKAVQIGGPLGGVSAYTHALVGSSVAHSRVIVPAAVVSSGSGCSTQVAP